VEFRFLYSQDVVSVRLENIREVSADDDLVFKLRYVEKDDEEKTLSFKSDTSFALSYTFIHLRYCEQLQKNFKKKGKTIAWEQEDPFSHHVSTYRTEDRTEDDRDIEDDKNRDDEDDEEHDEEEPTEKPKSTNDNIALDDFILLKVVGRGAFGKVLLCKFKVDNKIYAMKAILKKSLVKNKKEIEHTMTELSVMIKLSHPFLMKLHYAMQTEDKLIYILDYVNGGELFYHLENEGRFSIERTRFYIAELATALEFLHKNGVIYRDIKTENILLDSKGHIVLTDFGLSKELNPEEKNLYIMWHSSLFST